MRIEEDIKLGFKDVLIRSKRSILKSRAQVDLIRSFSLKYSTYIWSGIPIIASNMDIIDTFEMVKSLSNCNILTAVYKYSSLKYWKDFIKKFSSLY